MSRTSPLVQAFVKYGRVPECPIVDLHTHPDAFTAIYFPAGDTAGILRTMDRCGVRMIAIAPHNALLGGDAAYGNRLTEKMVVAHPDRFRGYWCYHPGYPQDMEEAKRAVDLPNFIGYKVHPAQHETPLTAESYQPLFAWANAHKRVVLAHTWKSETCGATQCRTIAERYPEMIFLLGHACFGEWDEVIALGREFPNVYPELTAAAYAPGFIERAVRGGIAHKLLYGTDLPWFDPFHVAGAVLFSDITDDDRHAILHGNAERILAQVGALPEGAIHG